MSNFKTYLNEDVSLNGISAYGKYVTVDIENDPMSELMSVKVSSSNKTLSLKSVENLKSEYRADEWSLVERTYTKILKKHSGNVEKLVEKFEKDLNSLISKIKSDVDKTFSKD